MQRRQVTIQDILNGTISLAEIPPHVMAQLQQIIGPQQMQLLMNRNAQPTDVVDGLEGLKFLPLAGNKFETDLIKFLETADTKTPQTAKIEALAMSLLQESFETEDFNILLQKLYENQTLGTGLCRKLLKHQKDVGYQCLDCQKDPSCIICAGCFEKSNHVGHRFFLKPNVSGMCDCGDKDAWDPKGNCSDHQGFVREDTVLPQKFKFKLGETLKSCFYVILLGYEVNDRPSKRTILNDLFKAVLESLIEFSQMYPTLTPVISKALYSPLVIGGKRARFYYDPNSNQGSFKLLPESHESEIPLLGHFIRLNQRISGPVVSKLKDFLLGLFVDHDFKLKFAPIFMDFYHWCASYDNLSPDQRPELSPLREINIQLLTSEELGYEAIKNSNFVQHLKEISKRLEKSCHAQKNLGLMIESLYFRAFLFDAVDNCLIKRQGVVYLFNNPVLLTAFFDVFGVIQKNEAQLPLSPLPTDLTNYDKATTAQAECELILLIKILQLSPLLALQTPAARLSSLVSALKVLKTLISTQDAEKQTEPQTFRLSLLAERTFVALLTGFCCVDDCKANQTGDLTFREVDVATFWKVCENVFDAEEADIFWKSIIHKIGRLTGFYREITRKCWVR